MKGKKKIKYKIGIAKFNWHAEHKKNEIKDSFVIVEGRDEYDAIIEHNKKFKNYYDVQEYLIIPLTNDMSYSVSTKRA
jgi:hypothetical protein